MLCKRIDYLYDSEMKLRDLRYRLLLSGWESYVKESTICGGGEMKLRDWDWASVALVKWREWREWMGAVKKNALNLRVNVCWFLCLCVLGCVIFLMY